MSFDVRWYDPRNGGSLQSGSVSQVQGGENTALGDAPDNSDKDWVVLVTLDASANIPQEADAGEDQVVTDTNGDDSESLMVERQ